MKNLIVRVLGSGLVLTLLSAATVACGQERTAVRELNGYLNKLLTQSREYVYTETPEEGKETSIEVRWDDDLRFYEKLKVDEMDAAEIVVADDAMALRVIDPSKVPAFEGGAASVAGSQVIGQELLSGRWVLDYQAAPPTNPILNDRGSIIIGNDPFLDGAYIFDYLKEAIRNSPLIWRYNPEDLTVYRSSEDPFPPPNENLGERRIDAFPQFLPGRSARGTDASVARTANFRRMAFYIRGEEIVRVLEKITVEGNPEIQRALRGGGAEHHLDILQQHREGRLPEPIRVRDVEIRIIKRGEEVQTVSLPVDTVLTANLAGVLGSLGFATGPAPAAPPFPPPEGQPPPEQPEGEPPPEDTGA